MRKKWLELIDDTDLTDAELERKKVKMLDYLENRK